MNGQPAERSLNEIDLLLREGLRRIAQTAETDLQGAQDPLEEALRLTEEQTMATLAAAELAQSAVQEIRAAHDTFIDAQLAQIEQALSRIVASQQGQDLAGQRLKKAITLLRAVESRISQTLTEIGLEGGAQMTMPAAGPDIDQGEVDALLAELGI
ncbi:protein phosphatase CheZ [Candidatus Igneacidithiobacillus taiwanensis]|uniref:protein phosphatase CheZ n=1 Tax=Candidatus Igneacidithiobacillus taiwanensis TaxID=1945924 RepID=UPI00289E9670|nr:protein phosphatase CheZ [Candidatus Igneacidithiobacillus taiwanensis]